MICGDWRVVGFFSQDLVNEAGIKLGGKQEFFLGYTMSLKERMGKVFRNVFKSTVEHQYLYI